jgi:geranylgeranyl pyrophosphate synthase
VYCGLWGDDAEAHLLAAATALLCAGLELQDSLASADPRACWAGYGPAELTLTAVTLLCSLPQLAIAALDVPSPVLAAMHRTLATGLLAIAVGQERELALGGSANPAPESVEVSIAGTSGEKLALFAMLGALLAGASPRVTAACGRLGRALGMASRLASDCHDLFSAAWSRRLASGIPPLPVAMHLGRLQGRERACFVTLLGEARADAAAQGIVRARLLAAGEPRRCAFMIEVYCRRARRALAETGLLEPARHQLQSTIAGISIRGQKLQ